MNKYDMRICHCGKIHMIPSEKSESITEDIFKGTENKKAISEIYYSHGIKVPMMNGYYATEYHHGIFYDGMVIANLYEIDRPI